MRVVFRVDASRQIGSGHLMRCLTLAEQLRKLLVDDIEFVSRDLEGKMFSLVEAKGYKQFVLPRHGEYQHFAGYAAWLTVPQYVDAQETIVFLRDGKEVEWLIVDSYAIDKSWESMVRPYVRHILAIDDLANREHDVDILLDQNFAPGRAGDYIGLVSTDCLLLMGLDYLLMREEFYASKESQNKKTGEIKNVFVFFGGSDLTGETSKALDAMEDFPELKVDVVVGGSNPQAGKIAARCKAHENWSFHCQIDYIASLMAKADLAIGAGGTTTWERCFLTLPSIVISVADNQSEGAAYYDSQGILRYLGESRQVKAADIVESIRFFQKDFGNYCRIQENMRNLFKNHVPYKLAKTLVHGWG